MHGYADLQDRTAIVTGASRGLGLAIANGLMDAGCRVVCTASQRLDELNQLSASYPDSVLAMRADVTDPDDCMRVVDLAIKRFGRLDILVNNAGRGMRTISEKFMTEPVKFWQTDINAWRRLIDTNVNGPFLMARSAVVPMFEAAWGRIINISMNYETMKRVGFSPYGPSKAALESETVIWAQDLNGTGVTVNSLLPGGATRTGMIPDTISDTLRIKLLEPEIIVPPLLYLASNVSDGVTGRRFVATLWPGTESAGWLP